VQTLTPEQAKQRADQEGAVFIDVRDGTERERDGAIPGSVHASRGLLEFYMDPQSPYHKEVFASGKPLIFYCASGGRSSLAADLAQRMGLSKISHLGGGFKGWTAAQMPVERS
jgi:rhodanese-related sulfurtransferase